MRAGNQRIALILIAVLVALGACTAGAVWGSVQDSRQPFPDGGD